MLKSLEKLRDTGLCDYNPIHEELTPYDSDELADEIQAEIDKFYLPRPLFEDGGPVQWGDRVAKGDMWIESPVDRITYYPDGTVELSGHCDEILYSPGERVSRLPEPDSQEKIDEDSTCLNAIDYCIKYHIDRVPNPMAAARLHLLARQRKLDGVE